MTAPAKNPTRGKAAKPTTAKKKWLPLAEYKMRQRAEIDRLRRTGG